MRLRRLVWPEHLQFDTLLRGLNLYRSHPTVLISNPIMDYGVME